MDGSKPQVPVLSLEMAAFHSKWLSIGGMLVLGVLTSFACKSRFVPVTTYETYFFQTPVTLDLAMENRDGLKLAAGLATTEIGRLEQLFDPVNGTGSLSQLNETRTSSDVELYQILARAQQVAEWTGGSLNIFMGYLEQVYGFHNLVPQPPERIDLHEVMLSLNRASIEFLPQRSQVRLPDDAYNISLTGIQEGYTADQALAHLSMAGVPNAQVRVGSQIACGGSPDGLGWPIDVMEPDSEIRVARLYVEYSGIATASVQDQAYTYRNLTYYNHLDPATGRPARRLSSVTVIAPSCEFAAALAKGIFIMDPEEGLHLLNDLPQVDGVLLSPDGQVRMSDSLFIWMGG